MSESARRSWIPAVSIAIGAPLMYGPAELIIENVPAPGAVCRSIAP